MKNLIEEYQDIILNVIGCALFYVLFFIIMVAIFKLCTTNMEFLL